MTEEGDERGQNSGQPVLGRQRRELIARLVDQRGAVRVRELTKRFGVSDMTIRRDIDELASLDRLIRVHGGATRFERAPLAVDEPGFAAKAKRRLPQKRAIAARAVSRIRPGSAIGITAGTTTYQMLAALHSIDDLTVVTNSLPVAVAFGGAASAGDVVLTGGSPTPSGAIVGPVAERCLADLRLDQVFMGVHGMDSAGFCAPSLAEAQTNLSFITAAREVCILADGTKWGVPGLGNIAALSAADVVISSDDLEAEGRELLSEQVRSLDLVEVST